MYFKMNFKKRIGKIKKEFTSVPMLALSATVTSLTLQDSIKNLGIPHCKVHRQPCDRPNLKFYVKNLSTTVKEPFKALVSTIKDYIVDNHFRGCTGIVYCMTQKETVEMAKALIAEKVKAWYYHAGMSSHDRQVVQGSWTSGAIHVVCATIAYGMGIDKPDGMCVCA
jgi:ATP-dependent DNA helicase Q1